MMKIQQRTLWLVPLAFLTMTATAQPVPPSPVKTNKALHVVLDDFQGYRTGGLPTRWQFLKGRTIVPVIPEVMTEQERFFIVEEDGNKFVRAKVTDQAHRILMMNGQRFDWDIEAYPYLRWDWRAIRLPEGAREDRGDKNDTGAALYVYFSRDWLGRPIGIKYTYSATLPVGTELSFGVLKVIVVSSATDGIGTWQTVERNVAADYERLFGRVPEDRPLSIALWSDSDSTHGVAIADFDNLMLMPGVTASD